MTIRRVLLSLVAVALVSAACIDRGYVLIGDNRTGQDFIARITLSGLPRPSGQGLFVREQRAARLPANSRVTVGVAGFTGPSIDLVEILSLDCAPIYQFDPQLDGGLFVVTDGPKIEVRKEWPDSADKPIEIPDCHPAGPLPVPTPTTRPDPIAATTPADGATNVSRTAAIAVVVSSGPHTGWPSAILRVDATSAIAKYSEAFGEDHGVTLVPFGPLLPRTEYVLEIHSSEYEPPIEDLTIHFTTGE